MNDWYTLITALANDPWVALPVIVTILPIELWMTYKILKGELET